MLNIPSYNVGNSLNLRVSKIYENLVATLKFATVDQISFLKNIPSEVKTLGDYGHSLLPVSPTFSDYYYAIGRAFNSAKGHNLLAKGFFYLTIDIPLIAMIYDVVYPQIVQAQSEIECHVVKVANNLESGLEGKGFLISDLSVSPGTPPQPILTEVQQLYPNAQDIATYNPVTGILYTLQELIGLYQNDPNGQLEAARATWRSSGVFFVVDDRCTADYIRSMLKNDDSGVQTGYGPLRVENANLETKVTQTSTPDVFSQTENNLISVDQPANGSGTLPYIIAATLLIAGIVGFMFYKSRQSH